ncbi:restriction endonuclease [Thermogemmatispora aurantia]|uniref:Restriction endonuclease n=1 Tax=Thermogemmatispora aurantia TaxID=2045279 RepID=A0A5J4K558_9CHLR|nr:restriction endonuclease [Thermogemmatispora aurantia]GER82643.1 restriction endonuclease [Thermogemmatispora aurantia]
MPVPNFQEFLWPLLELAGDGQEHTLTEAAELVARRFALSETERNEPLPSGKQAKFWNRLSWARTYLQKAQLLASAGRGRFRITERGRRVLIARPPTLDVAYLKRFPEFLQFLASSSHNGQSPVAAQEALDRSGQTPQELLETTYQTLKRELAQELLERVRKSTPGFFERLVLDLLLAMGYGGSRKEAAQALGGTGDGGVDGVIYEDRLGLDRIYVQAKRWQGTVGGPDVQAFAGALMGKKARKGIFMTTGTFSTSAQNYARSVDNLSIVLIDGEQMAQLMIDHGVGVTEETRYILKKIDSDYFEE